MNEPAKHRVTKVSDILECWDGDQIDLTVMPTVEVIELCQLMTGKQVEDRRQALGVLQQYLLSPLH